VTAGIFSVVRLAAWVSLLAGFVWAAFSIKTLHELTRNVEAYGFELVRSLPLPEMSREDAYKLMACTAHEADKLPDTVAPVCLLFGGGVILGVVPRRKKN
jgi:hypothetical protein